MLPQSLVILQPAHPPLGPPPNSTSSFPSLFLRLSFSLLAGDVITIPGGWEARGWKEDGKHVFLLIALVGGTANNPINIRCEFRGDEITEIKTAGAGGELNFSFATLRFPISLFLFLVLISCKSKFTGENLGKGLCVVES